MVANPNKPTAIQKVIRAIDIRIYRFQYWRYERWRLRTLKETLRTDPAYRSAYERVKEDLKKTESKSWFSPLPGEEAGD